MKLQVVIVRPGEMIERERIIEIDLPVVPRVGEFLVFGDDETFEVHEVFYRLSAEGVFTGRITLDVFSPGERPKPER